MSVDLWLAAPSAPLAATPSDRGAADHPFSGAAAAENVRGDVSESTEGEQMEIAWRRDVDAALVDPARQGRHALLYFSAAPM